jgi:hypothetical protein
VPVPSSDTDAETEVSVVLRVIKAWRMVLPFQGAGLSRCNINWLHGL